MTDAIVFLSIVTVTLAAIYTPFIHIFIVVNFPPRKIRIKNRQGEMVEYDFRKKNSPEDFIRIFDAYINQQ